VKVASCLLAVVGAGMLAACGGDSGSDSSSTQGAAAAPKQTKAQFIEKADRLCAQLNAALESVSSGRVEVEAGDIPDFYMGLMVRLGALGTPDDRAGLQKFFKAGDDIVSAKEGAEAASRSSNQALLERANAKAVSAQVRFVRAAKAYGFKVCSSVPIVR
jgi:hypothetical protein